MQKNFLFILFILEIEMDTTPYPGVDPTGTLICPLRFQLFRRVFVYNPWPTFRGRNSLGSKHATQLT